MRFFWRTLLSRISLCFLAAENHAGTAGGALFDFELGFENLLEQIASIDIFGFSGGDAFSALQQHDGVEKFSSEIKLVGDDDASVAVFFGEAAEAAHQLDFAANVEIARGLVEEEKLGLLREGAGENGALALAAGKFVHAAVGEMLRTDLREGFLGHEAIGFIFEAQAAAIGVAALQDVFPNVQRKQQIAFLMHDGDALGAFAERQIGGQLAVEFDAAGERLGFAAEDAKKGGFAAGVGAEDADDFALAGGKGDRAESEIGSGLGRGGIGVAGLFDDEANGIFDPAGESVRSCVARGHLLGVHAILRRNR